MNFVVDWYGLNNLAGISVTVSQLDKSGRDPLEVNKYKKNSCYFLKPGNQV